MFGYAARLLTDSTKKRLANTGLNIEINCLDDAENPRDLDDNYALVHTVSVSKDTKKNFSHKEAVINEVNRQANKHFGCTEEGVVWDTVNRTSLYSKEGYSIGSKDLLEDERPSSIIYLSKSNWLKSINADVFTPEMEADAHDLMKKEIGNYNAWRNGEVFEIQLYSDLTVALLAKHHLYNYHGYIYSHSGNVDAILNKMLDEVVDYIDHDKANTLEISLDAKEGVLLDSESIATILNRVYDNFGFKPIVGNAHVSQDGASITFNLWVDSLLNFSELLARRNEAVRINKIDNPLNVVKEITSGMDDVATFFIETVGENKPYAEWDSDHIKKLVSIIFKI